MNELIILYVGLAVTFAILVLGLGKAMLWCRRNNRCKFFISEATVMEVRTVEVAALPPQTHCHCCQPPWTITLDPKAVNPMTLTGYPPPWPNDFVSPRMGFYFLEPPSYEQATNTETTHHARI
ncbi:uncharacterized protein LOC124162646 [Ischnura elegans]|uniref:uncharacterized protein LOC124162646 n=1 Tax=Ischnura elegans TaxID=197161 RepID=UPI001ED87D30|nr:uncharacterized protein LOC124162646 [Ischnura elegans]